MAGVYNNDIPPSAPLANVANATQIPLGTAVTAGNPRSIADVTSAVLETESRKRFKAASNAAVTDDELAHSVARTTAVALEYAQGAYGGGVGAPAWAAPLVALVPVVTAMNTRVTAMDARLAAMDTRVTAMDARLAAMDTRVTAMDARLAAMDARQRVELAQRRNARLTATKANFPLQQLVKVKAGLGVPTPGQVATPAGASPGRHGLP